MAGFTSPVGGGAATLDATPTNRKELPMSSDYPSWLTPDGKIDMTRVPFDAFISQAVSSEVKEFISACHLLESLASCGRAEAGVFLLGLLSFYRDDLDRLEQVVEALRSFRCPESAQALLGELHRFKWSNTTRRYLNAVVKALVRFPPPLVLEGFSALASDPNQSPPARRRYRAIVDGLSFGPLDDGV